MTHSSHRRRSARRFRHSQRLAPVPAVRGRRPFGGLPRWWLLGCCQSAGAPTTPHLRARGCEPMPLSIEPVRRRPVDGSPTHRRQTVPSSSHSRSIVVCLVLRSGLLIHVPAGRRFIAGVVCVPKPDACLGVAFTAGVQTTASTQPRGGGNAGASVRCVDAALTSAGAPLASPSWSSIKPPHGGSRHPIS